MTTESTVSIANLVEDATETENNSANKSGQWPSEEEKREKDDELEAVFQEVVNRSV